VRVVDVALPAHGGARLLKIDTHDDLQLLGVFVRLGLEQLGVGNGLVVVMDRAGADHHDQAVILALQHVRDVLARALHQRQVRGRCGQPLFEQRGGHEGAHRGNAGVVDAGFVLGGKHGESNN
jgi:hypothetical protein